MTEEEKDESLISKYENALAVIAFIFVAIYALSAISGIIEAAIKATNFSTEIYVIIFGLLGAIVMYFIGTGIKKYDGYAMSIACLGAMLVNSALFIGAFCVCLSLKQTIICVFCAAGGLLAAISIVLSILYIIECRNAAKLTNPPKEKVKANSSPKNHPETKTKKEELLELKNLFEEKLITEEEYNAARKKVLER